MAEQDKKKTAAKQDAKAEAKPAGKAPARAGSLATPSAPEGERCRVDKCKQPIRAKGYCRKHYIGWRRGVVGKKHHYNTCSKEGCRKPAVFAGRCEEHKKGATAAAAAG
jgi:hypothetical protein